MTTSTTDAEAIARIVQVSMQDTWNDICEDTGCHPLDIKQIDGKLYLDQNHWSRMSGQIAANAILSYLASRREAVANDEIANALEKCDWSGASIGNKAIISAAIERLRENVLFCQDASDHLALIDYISDKIGLPKDQELSRENFAAWLAASRREAQEPACECPTLEHCDGSCNLPPAPAGDMGATYTIEHDGFTGTVIGSYTTREDKEGVVLQQVGTKVVHVYGRKWLKPAPPAPAGEVERLRGALEIIAGERQCLDNLMSNADVARAALNGGRE